MYCSIAKHLMYPGLITNQAKREAAQGHRPLMAPGSRQTILEQRTEINAGNCRQNYNVS